MNIFMRQRFLSLVLTIMLLIGMFPLKAWASLPKHWEYGRYYNPPGWQKGGTLVWVDGQTFKNTDVNPNLIVTPAGNYNAANVNVAIGNKIIDKDFRMASNFNLVTNDPNNGYLIINADDIGFWAQEFGGNVDWVVDNTPTFGAYSNGQYYTLANLIVVQVLSGARDLNWNLALEKGTFEKSKWPTGTLNFKKSVKVGETVTITGTGTADNGWVKKGTMILYIDGSEVSRKSFTVNSSFTFNKSFSQVGYHDIKLVVTDTVNRSVTYTDRIVVEGDTPLPPPPPLPPNNPPAPPPPPAPDYAPVAKLSFSPAAPKEGDKITIKDNSMHPGSPEESIESWEWEAPGHNFSGPGNKTATWNQAGNYTVTLTVTDQDGESSTDSVTIPVAASMPVAAITVDKDRILENRQIAISADKSQAFGGRTIDHSKNEWQIIRPNGSSRWSGVQALPPDNQPPNAMFNSPGEWKIRLRVTDSSGNQSEWAEKTVNVLPDQPPVADFIVPLKAIRNVVDNFTIHVQDASYVPGTDAAFGDIITHRTWTLYYDSNGDDNYERKITANSPNTYADLITNGSNDPQPSIKFYKVGKFKLELSVQESYSGWYATVSGKTANTASKVLAEKIIEVDNLAPVTLFKLNKLDSKLDVVFVFGKLTNKEQKIATYNVGAPEFKQSIETTGITDYILDMKTVGGGNIEITKNTIPKYYSYSISSGGVPLYKIAVSSSGPGFYVDYYDPNSKTYKRGLETDEDVVLHASGHGYSFGVTDHGGGRIITRFSCGHDESTRTIWVDENGNLRIDYEVIEDEGYRSTQYFDYSGDFRLSNPGQKSVLQDSGSWISFTGRHTGQWGFTYTINTPVTFETVLNNAVNIRTNSTKYLVLVSEEAITATPDFGKQELLNYLIANNIVLVLIGNNTTKNQLSDVIAATKGIYIPVNDDMRIPMNELAKFILPNLNQSNALPNIILVNQPIYIEAIERDLENDTIDNSCREWVFEHHPEAVENDEGYWSKHNQVLNAPPLSFDKPGLYIVRYRVKDIPSTNSVLKNRYSKWSSGITGEILVLRPPVADFTVGP